MTAALRRLRPLPATVTRWARPARRQVLAHATAIRTTIGLGFMSAFWWDWLGRPAGLASIGVSWLVAEWLAE